MRDAIRIQMTPGDYADHQRAERERICDELIEEFADAAERRREWYQWILNGCKPLTREEYANVGKFAKTARVDDQLEHQANEQLQVGA